MGHLNRSCLESTARGFCPPCGVRRISFHYACSSGPKLIASVPRARVVPISGTNFASFPRPGHYVCGASAGNPSACTDDASYWKTVIPSALAMMLCNIDRICLSVAMLPLAAEMGWAEGAQGIIQSAFLWGYVSTQLIGGTLADRYGGKKVMTMGMIFFSTASVLLPLFAITPFTISLGIVFPAVLFSRFLVGIGEGVALPSVNNLMARNIGLAQRASAIGGMFTGFHSGNLVGLLVSPLLLENFGWRSVFYVFGALGVPLVFMWNAVVPDTVPLRRDGEEEPSQKEEREMETSKVSLSSMLKNKAVWAIITANVVNHWGYFMYLNWMPTYFYKVLGMNLRASSFMSFVPWLVMAFGSVTAGYVCDSLVNSGVNRTSVRKLIQSIALLGPVPALIALSTGTLSVGNALIAMTFALGLTSVGQFTANISEVAPKHAGRLFGLSNTFGCFSGIAGVSVAGFVVEKTGSFESIFLTTAVLNILGTIVWQLFATAERQF